MRKKKDPECEGQCCNPLPEELAVYVPTFVSDKPLRLCHECAESLGPEPQISNAEKAEYRHLFEHFKKTGEAVLPKKVVDLHTRIKNLAMSVRGKNG